MTGEIKHLNIVFAKNNYNTDFIERNTYIRPNDTSNNSYTTTAIIPYIRGTSEAIAHILRPHNIRVAHKPIFTLRRLPTNVKGKNKPEDRPGAVYKIHWSDCQATYIGETSRNLTTLLTEHKRATKKGDLNNNIAEHHLKTSHAIDWDSATCLINLQYRLLSTNYTRKLVYKLRTNCPKSLSTSSRTLKTFTQQETVTPCLLFFLLPIYLHNLSPHMSSQPIASHIYQQLLCLLTNQIAHQGF